MPLDTPRNPFREDRYDLVNVDIGNPAVGQPVAWDVPDNRVIHVVSVYFAYNTSAVVADRIPYLCATIDGGPLHHYNSAHFAQAANLAYYYYFSVGAHPIDLSIAPFNANRGICPLSACIEMKPGDIFNIWANNRDAADQISDIHLLYREWTED